jgi:DNA-binding response OmpR family regulator
MRILVVEDEKKLADIIARGLRAERYAVDVAYDGGAGGSRIAWPNLNTAQERLRTTVQLLNHATEAFKLAQARY